MRSILAAVTGTVLVSASSALAADALDIPFTWSGAYAGAFAGIASRTGDVRLGEVNGALLNFDVQQGLFQPELEDRSTDMVGGLRAGFDAQAGKLTFGARVSVEVQADNASTAHAQLDGNCTPATGGGPLFCGLDTRTRYTTKQRATVSGEVLAGVALGRTRIYGTAGLASARFENVFNLDLVPTTPANLAYSNVFVSDEWLQGASVGVGVEHAYSSNVSLSLDYKYYDFEDVTVRAEDAVFFPGQSIDYTFKNRGHTLQLGANYRF